MFQDFWKPPPVEFSKLSQMGGYLNKVTKETITLKKKEAKILHGFFNTPSILSQSDSLQLACFNYTIDILTKTEPNNVCTASKFKIWNAVIIPPILNNTKKMEKLLKQKLKLNNDEVVYFENIVKICIKNYNTPNLIYYLENKSYAIFNILLPSSYYKQDEIIKEKDIPMKEMGNLNSILDEKLVDTLNQDMIPKQSLEIKPLDTINQFLFIINNNCETDNKTRVSLNLLFWEVKLRENSNRIDDNIFKEIEEKLFDIQFHKLEFFKIAYERLPKKVVKRVTVKKFWKLSNPKLKQMKWNPFRQWNNPSVIKEINEEEIKLVLFNIPNTTINVNYVPNTNLELYDSNKMISSNFQITATNITTKNMNDSIIKPILSKGESSSITNILSITKKKSVSENFNTEDNTTNNSYPTQTTPINTSLIPQKRSFLDSDLQSLIEKKKISFKQNKIQQNSNVELPTHIIENDVSEILQSGIFDRQIELSLENSHMKEVEQKTKPPNIIFDLFNFKFNINSSYSIEDRLIIFNVNRINENYKLLHSLIKNNDLSFSIIEHELFVPCDLILNSSTCVIRLQVENFFQRDGSNRLYYFDIISSSLAEYKRIKVMFEYKLETVLYDKEIFWKIFYFLPFPKFELFFVPKDNLSVLNYHIRQIIWKEAVNNFTEEEFMEEQINDAEVLLSNLKFNPILIKTLLHRSTLSDLLSQVNNELDPHLIQIMTIPQLNRLKKLNSINW